MAVSEAYSDHVAARLGDFFDEKTHWQRRLWNAGLVLSLREVIEACEAMRERQLSKASVTWLVETVRGKIAVDPGSGRPDECGALREALRGAPEPDGVAHRTIRVCVEDIREHYFSRWRDALANGAAPPRPEQTARSIAAHLLDQGLPASYLLEWLRSLGRPSVVDLIDAAEHLPTEPPSQYELLAMFGVAPRTRAQKPAEWRDSRQVLDWLRDHSIDERPRQRGGLLLTLRAFDAQDAAKRAGAVLDSFVARVAVGTRSSAVFLPDVIVAGTGPVSLSAGRRVEVRALERESRVLDLSGGAKVIDAALELLSSLESGATAPAVSGGWSAIEILLGGPGDEDKVSAADRLGTLVACSWPRAELTDLAWSWIKQSDDYLATQFAGLATNRERAAAVAVAIQSGATPAFSRASDVAAATRMAEAHTSPQRLLADVKAHVAESVRRLYRQRNLVMHGGRTDAVALESTLRSSAPLVGAGVDRIVHGYLTKDQHPLELLARAQFEIERAGSSSAPILSELLE